MKNILSKLFYVLICVLVLSVGMALAHPPTDMKLNYDKKTKVLHIEMRHVTSNTRTVDFIRRLVIYKNEIELTAINLVKQTTPTSVIQDVPLDTIAGDAIRVVAYSSGGGSADEVIIIPEEGEEE